jgi:outer membrane protein TolC
VVELALQQHPEYQISQARQAVADRVLERTGSLLAGDAAVNLRHKNDSLGTDNGLSEWSAGLEMPIWLPGQKESYRQLAQGLGLQADASQQLLAWTVAGVVRERAWALRLAQSKQDLASEQLQAAQALEQEVQRRRAAGELADADWVLARQETLSRQALLQEAKGQVETAANAWQAYTGLVQLPEQLQEQPAENPDFPASHPQLLDAAGKVQKSRAERQRVRIERRSNPMLSLSANHERGNASADYDDSLELMLTLPLGSSTHAGPRLAEAEADLTGAEAARELARVQLEHGLEQARLEMAQTASAITLAEQRKALTMRGEHLAQRAFELGESDLVQLLRARNLAADAALELERKRLEHERAIARHNQIFGVMPK